MKDDLRAVLKAGRKAFVTARGGREISFHSSLYNHLKLLSENNIFISSYVAMTSECDVMTALGALPPCRAFLCLPITNSRNEAMTFRRWSPGDPLDRSTLGFQQPYPDQEEVFPGLILTPLLGFDRSGNRLGYGAGHYDRSFQTLPDALRIGIAWSCQEVDVIPSDDWDVPLDAVMTEKDWIVMPNSRLPS